MAGKFTEDGNDKNYLTKKLPTAFKISKVISAKANSLNILYMLNKSRIL
jgi:hypothetical protein